MTILGWIEVQNGLYHIINTETKVAWNVHIKEKAVVVEEKKAVQVEDGGVIILNIIVVWIFHDIKMVALYVQG